MIIEKLKAKIIWWQDFRHSEYVSIDIGGLIYHTALPTNTMIDPNELYEIFSKIIYFDIPDEDLILEEQIETPFSPHQILNEEEMEVKYFDINDQLRSVTIQ